MSKFSAFLRQNVVVSENIKRVVSDRFRDEEGNPVEWEFRAISSTEDDAIKKTATRRVQVPGRKGVYTTETDAEKYTGKLAAACIVYPDLLDDELMTSWGATSPENLLKTMLLPGEFADVLNIVSELTGYSADQDELVEEVKNS